MFLSRYCTKLTSPAKVLFANKLTLKEKYFGLPYSCQCHNIQISRLLASTANLQDASQRKYSTKDLQSTSKPFDSTSLENTLKSTKPSSSDLLEKLIAGLSTDIHNKNRVYKNDLVRIVNKVQEINFSTKKQGLLLIRCCTELMPDETPSTRMALVEHIWKTIKPHTEFEVDHYNELLRVYIANNRTLTASTFIQQMAPAKPNMTTYELILRALAEAGDLNQCTEVISNMKAQNLPANENIFNSLIICQGKAGNLQNIREVLTMMKSLKLNKSIDTYTAIARALAWNKNTHNLLEEMEKARSGGLQFGEEQVMEIVRTLALVGLYGTIPQVLKFLPSEVLQTPSISAYMQSVSTLLVFQNHPLAALEIYKCLPLPSFGPKDDQGLHGRSLVRDCVKAAMPSSIIAMVTQELMSSGRNPIALHNASEAALQLGKVPLALDMFTRMQQLGLPIRPHYFWPILLHSSRSYGEKGIMNTLSTMMTMDVKPDYETIMEYTLPYVSFTSPQNLMKKFLDTGMTVSMVLTPMMDTLLKTGQVRAASEICELFEGKIDAEKILKPLVRGYLISEDVKSTVYILEDVTKKARDKNKDWIGRFLCVFMQHKKVVEDLTELMNLMKAIKAGKMKISTSASDYCMSRLPEKHGGDTAAAFRDLLVEITDDRLVDEGDLFVQQMPHPGVVKTAAFRDLLVEITDDRLVDEGDLFAQQMPHPKHMNEESLRAHLNELEAKGMNTRGVLRKLLQQYCRDGNLAEARKIAEKCQKEGVFLSAGMKAAIFDLHVKLGELDLAEMALADLNKTSPNFNLDEFKVIDFATLMVYRKKIDQAYNLINEQSKKRRIVGGRGIAMNVWRLLDATAAHGTHIETHRMFDLLTSLRYCKPSNVLLGPLIRVHLKNDNLQEAVNEFVRLANKYSKTPLKHELLCNILTKIGEGQSEEKFIVNEKANGRFNKMAQTILNIDKKVHGQSDVQLTLISALAEVGYKKTLRKLFLDPSVTFHPDALLRRCERFADEKKVKALDTIAECARGIRRLPVQEIYDLMLDVYQRDDEFQGALSLWTKMQEHDVVPSQKFVTTICSMLKANNKPIPSELIALLDKQETKQASSV